MYDKQANFSFVEGKKSCLSQKDIELSPATNLPEGLTLGGLFDAGKQRMKNKSYTYNALSNNCQRFVEQNLDTIGSIYDREFVVQNLEKLAKRLPSWQKRFGVLLTSFAREADKVVSIGVDKAKDVRRGVKDTTKSVAKSTKKIALKKRNASLDSVTT